MTRRDWWLGVTVVVLAILVHAALPRYTWTHVVGGFIMRTDRWSGSASVGTMTSGYWVPMQLVNGKWAPMFPLP
jgi:hypothetical protein